MSKNENGYVAILKEIPETFGKRFRKTALVSGTPCVLKWEFIFRHSIFGGLERRMAKMCHRWQLWACENLCFVAQNEKTDYALYTIWVVWQQKEVYEMISMLSGVAQIPFSIVAFDCVASWFMSKRKPACPSLCDWTQVPMMVCRVVAIVLQQCFHVQSMLCFLGSSFISHLAKLGQPNASFTLSQSALAGGDQLGIGIISIR